MSLAGPSLSGLADAVLADPTLDEAIADARGGMVRALDLTGPGRAAAVRGRRPGPRRPHRARGHRDRPRGRGPRRGARRRCSTPTPSRSTRAGRRCRTSGSARAATPSAAGSRCCAGCATPAPTPPTARCKVVVAPVRSVLQPQVKGLGDLEPVELVPGDTAPTRGRRAAARRRGVLPGRPGRAARRVRGPRRHRRRLPADRGAPAAGGVLGRRRRGDPQLLGRRPAHPRDGRPAVGAAVPRAAAHRRRPPPRRGARRAAPAAGRAHRQDRRRHRRRGHGVAGPGAGRRDGAAGRPAARRHPRAGARPRAGPPPGPRPGRDQRGVPRRELGGRRRRRRGADRPRRRVVPLPRRRPRARARRPARAWWTVSPFGLADDAEALRADDDDETCRRVPTRTLPMQAADAYRGDVDRAFARPRAAGAPRATARSSCTPATARPSAPSRCSASATSRPGWSTRSRTRPPPTWSR